MMIFLTNMDYLMIMVFLLLFCLVFDIIIFIFKCFLKIVVSVSFSLCCLSFCFYPPT